MKIIGLDCASKTGFAISERGKIIESGVQDFTKKRGESNGLMFLRFRKWLKELVELTSPDLLAYERAHFRGGAATEICVGLQTRVQEMAVEFNIPCAPVATGTLKKFATGIGNAGKPEMMEASIKHLHRNPIDDNEADAVFISLWASDNYEE